MTAALLCAVLLLFGCGENKTQESPVLSGPPRTGPTLSLSPTPMGSPTPALSPTPTLSPAPTLIPGKTVVGWRITEEMDEVPGEKTVRTLRYYDENGMESCVEIYEDEALTTRTETTYWAEDVIEAEIVWTYGSDGTASRRETRYVFTENGLCLQKTIISYTKENEVFSIYKREYEYYENGVRKQEIATYDNDTVIKYYYNEDGKLTLMEENEDGELVWQENYQYPDEHTVRRDWTKCGGEITEYDYGYEVTVYDAQGRQLRCDWYGYTHFYEACEYGEYGVLWKEWLNDEGYVRREEYTYDSNGLVATSKYFSDYEGISETAYQYDEAGNLTREIVNGICVALYSYDSAGHCVEESSSSDGETFSVDRTYSYDDAGRLVFETEVASNRAVSYVYDDFGNLIEKKEMKDQSTQYFTRYETLRTLTYGYEPIYADSGAD
ncbi:MAG: RHS repeat domain-containing protein [Lachnospiraceae bacterium]|nr:RHS repeat domain-containing protein [Lachnospiraceae bacterium]